MLSPAPRPTADVTLRASHVEAAGLSLCMPFAQRASGLNLAVLPRFSLAVLLPS